MRGLDYSEADQIILSMRRRSLPQRGRLPCLIGLGLFTLLFALACGSDDPAATPVASTPAQTPASGAPRIAFASDRGGTPDVWVMNTDGSDPKQLTDIVARDDAPSWSPDGSRIAYLSDRDGNFEVYVMNADGRQFGRPRRLQHVQPPARRRR